MPTEPTGGATRVHRSTKPCTACKTLIHHKADAPYQGRPTRFLHWECWCIGVGWSSGGNVGIDYRWSDDIDGRLGLDRAARHERDQRRRGSAAEQSDSPV